MNLRLLLADENDPEPYLPDKLSLSDLSDARMRARGSRS